MLMRIHLPAVENVEDALKPDSPLVHEELGTNLATHVRQERGNFAEAKTES